jgi:hypothetical protein
LLVENQLKSRAITINSIKDRTLKSMLTKLLLKHLFLQIFAIACLATKKRSALFMIKVAVILPLSTTNRKGLTQKRKGMIDLKEKNFGTSQI